MSSGGGRRYPGPHDQESDCDWGRGCPKLPPCLKYLVLAAVQNGVLEEEIEAIIFLVEQIRGRASGFTDKLVTDMLDQKGMQGGKKRLLLGGSNELDSLVDRPLAEKAKPAAETGYIEKELLMAEKEIGG